MAFDWQTSAMESIKTQRYTIEPHGDGYAIYLGRDMFHHGLNLAHLSEVTPDFRKFIEDSLNATLPKEKD